MIDPIFYLLLRQKVMRSSKSLESVFAPQDYGMATAQGSELREKINRTILSIIEKGQMDEIRSKWFGSEP